MNNETDAADIISAVLFEIYDANKLYLYNSRSVKKENKPI